MTGGAFEKVVCDIFRRNGFWALNVPRNNNGGQPFDILAIRGSEVWAVDCKVCAEPRLPLRRIEDNQRLAFEQIQKKTCAVCGFVCWHEGAIYFCDFDEALSTDRASLPLRRKWIYGQAKDS